MAGTRLVGGRPPSGRSKGRTPPWHLDLARARSAASPCTQNTDYPRIDARTVLETLPRLECDARSGGPRIPKYAARLSHDLDGSWVASALELPNCWSRGRTRDEALDKLRDEIRGRIELCPCSGVADDFVEIAV